MKNTMSCKALLLLCFTIWTLACSYNISTQARKSDYPIAYNVSDVGTYPALTKSGAGYVYDKVLEYRVWVDHPGGDTYKAFATYEEAKDYSERTMDAEEPLVLILQEEHINEPSPGVFEHIKEQRITEWRVEWLKGNLRNENPIPEYIKRLKSGK